LTPDLPRHRPLWWFIAGGWLLATLVIQFLIGWWLAGIGMSLTGPALAVTGTGVGLSAIGALSLQLLSGNRGGRLRTQARVLGIGSVVLGVAGWVWASPSTASVALFCSEIVVGVAVVLAVVDLVSRKGGGVFLGTAAVNPAWLIVPSAVLLLATLTTAALPSAVSLRFRAGEETTLDHDVPLAMVLTRASSSGCVSGTKFPSVPVFGRLSTVCSGGSRISFEAAGNDAGYGYVYAPGASADGVDPDGCVVHLAGPWWEIAPGGGLPCPGGFTSVPGA
jgi:hypothetical protein